MLHFKMYIKLNANTSLTLSDISVLLPIELLMLYLPISILRISNFLSLNTAMRLQMYDLKRVMLRHNQLISSSA